MENKISDILVQTYRFTRSRKSGDNSSRSPLTDGSCYLRIHDNHYLIWSDALVHFSIAIKHEVPKARAGGDTGEWSEILLPSPSYTMDRVVLLLKFFNITQ